MAAQPQGHPVISADHVTTPQNPIPLPQTLMINFSESDTPPNPNTNPLRNGLPAQSHPSAPFNSKIQNAPSPHISAPDNVATRDPLPAPSDCALPQISTSATPQLPPVSPTVAQTIASRVDSPKRRKIEIVALEAPKLQAVVDALAPSPSQLLQPAPQSANLDTTAPSQAWETPGPQSLSQGPQQAGQGESPDTGRPVKEPHSDENTKPAHTTTDNMDISCTGLQTEQSLKVVTLSDSEHMTTEPGALRSESQDADNASIGKRVSSSSSVSSVNGSKAQDSDARQPDVKRQKTEQGQKPHVPSVLSIGSTSVNEGHSDETVSAKSELDMTNGDVTRTMSEQKEKSVSSPVTPSSGVSLPLLRSSPVFVENGDRVETPPPESNAGRPEMGISNFVSPDPKEGRIEVNMPPDQQQQSQAVGQSTTSGTKRKKKTVSWAPEDKLVDVQFIDNRIELVRSWDADSQITLPFAPPTLLLFQQALKEQDAAKRNEGRRGGKGIESVSLRSMPKLTSFKEARKREHDMEQDRARQAREELKERLNAMTPSAPWKAPTAIVLPAECRIEDASVERFNLVDADGYTYESPDPDARSPPSPPHQPSETYETPRNRNMNVPFIPLSDRLAESTGDEVESLTAKSDVGSHDYRNPEPRQGYYRDIHDGNVSNDGGGRNLAPRPDSSKEYHFRDSRNGMRSETDLDLRSDSRNNARGGYGAVQHGYSDTNPPAPPSQTHAVQHLLSALQSSGLLKQGNGFLNAKNNGLDYNRNSNEQNQIGLSDNSYRESQQGDRCDMRSHDSSDNYENESSANDRAQEDIALQGQGMAAPDGNIPPPMLAPPMGAPFPQGMQQPGMMDMMPFPGPMGHPPMGMPPMGLPPPGGMPPGAIPPPPMGIPPPLSMLQMMGVPMPMMPIAPGIQMNDGGQGQSTSNNGGHSGTISGRGTHGCGRGVETISRPKSKPLKQRKRCKYFGTKQGCRDGSSCMFAHN